MRTENDIRTALTTLESEAPDRHDVLMPLARSRPPRRPRVLVAVAAGTALAIGAVPMLRAVTDDGHEPAGPAAPRWTYSFTLVPPAGWTTVSQDVRTGSQSANLTGPAKSQCIVTSFEPGVFDTGLLSEKREPVTVNGHRGFIADVYRFIPQLGGKQRGSGTTQVKKEARPVVAWQYAPDAWRISDCGIFRADIAGSRDTIVDQDLMMARAVSDTPRPLRIPVRVGYLPAGWTAQSATNDGQAGGSQPDFVLDAPPTGRVLRPFPDMVRPDAQPPQQQSDSPETFHRVSIMYSKGTAPATERHGTRTTIHGLPAWVWNDPKPGTRGSNPPATAAGITIEGDGFHLRVESMTTDADFTDELRRIADQLTIAADPLDESTWFDGEDAIP